MWSGAANAIVRTLLGPACLACGTLLDEPLTSPMCGACWAGISLITPPCCLSCGEPLLAPPDADRDVCDRCASSPPVFAAARSAGRYDGPLREMVHALKYGKRRYLALPLGALMRAAGAPLLRDADAVVPVPLHPWRLWQRGFNQADDLACRLHRPVWRVLRRVRHGPAQAGLPAAHRHENVERAFRLARRVHWFGGGVAGRTLVLVDDVMTTGATLDACGRVLLDAGATRILALTAARAVARHPLPRHPPRRPGDARRR